MSHLSQYIKELVMDALYHLDAALPDEDGAVFTTWSPSEIVIAFGALNGVTPEQLEEIAREWSDDVGNTDSDYILDLAKDFMNGGMRLAHATSASIRYKEARDVV